MHVHMRWERQNGIQDLPGKRTTRPKMAIGDEIPDK